MELLGSDCRAATISRPRSTAARSRWTANLMKFTKFAITLPCRLKAPRWREQLEHLIVRRRVIRKNPLPRLGRDSYAGTARSRLITKIGPCQGNCVDARCSFACRQSTTNNSANIGPNGNQHDLRSLADRRWHLRFRTEPRLCRRARAAPSTPRPKRHVRRTRRYARSYPRYEEDYYREEYYGRGGSPDDYMADELNTRQLPSGWYGGGAQYPMAHLLTGLTRHHGPIIRGATDRADIQQSSVAPHRVEPEA